MFGRDTNTPKSNTLFEPTPLRTTSIDQTLSSTEELNEGTLEPYHKSYFYWINPQGVVTLEDIAELSRYQYGEHFTYHTS